VKEIIAKVERIPKAEREEVCCEIKMSNLKKDGWIHSRHMRILSSKQAPLLWLI